MAMRIQSELCHIDSEKCIVLVSAWDKEILLGSSLGQALNAEDAEERAIERLTRRLNQTKILEKEDQKQNKVKYNKNVENLVIDNGKKYSSIKDEINVEDPNHNDNEKINKQEPIDWSEELAQIDIQLNRIGWSKKEENQYLERSFAVSNRNRITKYGDLKEYLHQLSNISRDSDPKDVNILSSRPKLLERCDQILLKLNWNKAKARNYLEHSMKVSSRQSLDNEKLEEFNKLLEVELQKK